MEMPLDSPLLAVCFPNGHVELRTLDDFSVVYLAESYPEIIFFLVSFTTEV